MGEASRRCGNCGIRMVKGGNAFEKNGDRGNVSLLGALSPRRMLTVC